MKLSRTVLPTAIFLAASIVIFAVPATPTHRSPIVTDDIWVGILASTDLWFEDVDFIVKDFHPYDEPVPRLDVGMVGELAAIPTRSAASTNAVKSGGLILVVLETNFALPRNTRLRWNGAGAAFPPPECNPPNNPSNNLVDGCTMNGLVFRRVAILGH